MKSANTESLFPVTGKQYLEVLQTLQAYQSAVNEAAIVSITDIQGSIVYVNQKFVEVSKYSAAELIGQNHRLINSGYHTKAFFSEMWQRISSGKHWRGEIKNKAKDGRYYWVDTVITPMFDEAGRIFQYLSIRNLITVQKENEAWLLAVQKEMARRKQQLKDAQKVAKTGSWYLSVPGENQLEWSDETYRIFEIEPGTEMNYHSFMQTIHTDDRMKVDACWQEALKTGSYAVEHRIITKSGEKWVSERARFEFDETSSLTSALGTVQDITEKKKIEDSLRESENLYKTLFNNSPFAIGIADIKTLKCLEVNETATKLYGYSREEFLNLSLYDLRVPAEHDKLRTQLSLDNYPNDRSTRRHQKKNGEIIYVEPAITSIMYKGRPAFLATMTDVTARLKIEEELKQIEKMRQKDIIEAEERSRSLIGMELHDNINQLLAASRLYLQHIKTETTKNKELIKSAVGILGTALDEIRKLSASLVTPIIGNNFLKESVQHLLKNYQLLHASIELNINIQEESLQEALKTNIYRIIQEQMSNIVKHSGATKVRISLLQYADFIELEIADTGRGFNLRQAKKGIGLTNIIYRAEAYGGKVTIDTGVNKGCKINIRFSCLPAAELPEMPKNT